MFVDYDLQAVKRHIAADAERKSHGKGSLLKSLEKKPDSALTLKQIIFFDSADIASLEMEYPHKMWDRLRQRVDGGTGMLAIYKVGGAKGKRLEEAGRQSEGLLAFVIKEVDSRPQVVYADN